MGFHRVNYTIFLAGRVGLSRGRLGRLRESLLPADEERFELLARLHANLGELASVVVEHVLVPRSAVGSVPDRLLRKAELPELLRGSVPTCLVNNSLPICVHKCANYLIFLISCQHDPTLGAFSTRHLAQSIVTAPGSVPSHC